MAVTYGSWQGRGGNEYSSITTDIVTTDAALVLYFIHVPNESTDCFVEDSDGTKLTLVKQSPGTNEVSMHGMYFDGAGTYNLTVTQTAHPGNMSRGGFPIYGLPTSNISVLTRDTTHSYETGTDSTSSDALSTSPDDIILTAFNAGSTNTVASDNTDWTNVGSQAYSASSIDVWRRTGTGSSYNPGLLHVDAANREMVSVSLKSLLGGNSQVIWMVSHVLALLTVPFWMLYNAIKEIL